jgi:meso-butanediol dehydrogenase/(S,S)-butanediol dehydrogenase/diacetyl reductase
MAEHVAILTGAGGAIGRATAIDLSRRGYALVLVGRTDATLVETARLVGTSITLVADVSHETSADRIISAAIERFGRIDALINNAGSAPVRTIEQTTPAIWRNVIDINLSGSFFLCRRC